MTYVKVSIHKIRRIVWVKVLQKAGTRWNYFGENKDVRMVGRGFEMFPVSDLQEKKEGLGSRGPRLQCSSDWVFLFVGHNFLIDCLEQSCTRQEWPYSYKHAMLSHWLRAFQECGLCGLCSNLEGQQLEDAPPHLVCFHMILLKSEPGTCTRDHYFCGETNLGGTCLRSNSSLVPMGSGRFEELESLRTHSGVSTVR